MSAMTLPDDSLQHLFEWIEHSERLVDHDSLNLYAGTNRQSPAVRRATASTLNARPSLGNPGDKYETGLAYSDRIEEWVERHLCALFGAHRVEYRVLSGSLANLYAYLATTRPGDTVYAMPEHAAGHATHHQVGAAGLLGLTVLPIPCRPGTHLIDWDTWQTQLPAVRPSLIILGTSLPLLPVDIGRAHELAQVVGARVMYDAAHVAGLVAVGRFQRPLVEGADLLTMSTYKTFGGPAGGLVATRDEDLAHRLDAIAYPGLTANFDMARIAGLAVAALELETFGEAYAEQCLRNAQQLVAEIVRLGIPVWRPDGEQATNSHLVAVEALRWGGGTRAARMAEASQVLFSGIPLPLAPIAGDYNGIRFGVQEITRLGMREHDMPVVARFIDLALNAPDRGENTRREVAEFRRDFQTIHFGFAGAG
ncbi:MAG: beta-eliminating lyase-related protein [Thermaerobacter sp.]|nr:beta-eliminating lyase-related protein [Thermaerobacter sp.]